MKGIIVLLSLLVTWVFSFDVEAKSAGRTGVTFLKIPIGAKPTSMGEAFCAVADDISTIYWNPAGLALFENRELAFTHISWFEKINYEYLSCLQPLQELGIKIPGVLAGSLAYLGINDIKEYGITKDSYLGSFNAYDLLLKISYARRIKPDVSSGVNLKLINQKIKSSSSGFAADIGLLSKTPIKNLTAGITLQNIALFNNFKDNLPFNIKLGSCYKLLKDNILTLAMDIDLPSDTDPKLHLGAEYLYPDIEGIELAIRSGYKTGVDCGKLGFGFGVKFDKYKFDYAYSSYNDLGNIHQLSFNMKFDKIKPQSTDSKTKIKDTKQVISPSTTSDSKSNVNFESEGKKATKYIEFENTTNEKTASTSNNTPKNELKKQIVPSAVEEIEEETVIEESDKQQTVITKKNEQEDKTKNLLLENKIVKQIEQIVEEEKTAMKELNKQQTLIDEENEQKEENYSDEKYSKARIILGGIK